MDYKNDKIGALWLGKTSKGVTMMSGSIEINGEKLKIVAFKNNKRPDKKDPDFQVFISRPKEEDGLGRAVSFDSDEIPF